MRTTGALCGEVTCVMVVAGDALYMAILMRREAMSHDHTVLLTATLRIDCRN